MSENKPIKNPGLIMAIRVMREDPTQESQARVVDEIMKARFLAPVVLEAMPFTVGSNRTSFRDRCRMKFLSIHDGKGNRFFPAFTDDKELEKFELERGQQVSHLTFEDYAKIIMDDQSAGGFVINPYSDNLVCDRDMVMSWISHRAGQHVNGQGETGQRIRLGRPKDTPAELIQAVSDYLKEQELVEAAYLSMMQPEGEKSGYLIVVDMEGGEADADAVYDGIAQAAKDHLNGMYLNVEPVSSGFGQAAIKDQEPFYRK
ncbi:MAG: enhanced serine sensitivity protein SseB [Clostridiaceae bacterium]|nr:enhanced serine sensitivity protein SseB [Clostridiaceae bacterium]